MHAAARPVPWLLDGVALALFLVAGHDLGRGYEFLPATIALLLLLVSLALLALVLVRRRRAPYQTVAVFLLGGATLGLGLRSLGYDRAIARLRSDWESVRDEEPRGLASRAAKEFRRVCDEALATAEELGSSDALLLASERPERADWRAGAFLALAETSLPRAHPLGVPGASLYDATVRPLAWAGENAPRSAILEAHVLPVARRAQILEAGADDFVVAIEPLPNGRGFATVEVPLIADPRLENRYLERYDALSSWSGRSVALEVPVTEAQALALASEFESEGELHWDVEGMDRRFRFALRCGDGELLGAGSLASEAPQTARLEARARFARAASVALVVFAAAALLALLRAGAHPVALVFAVALARIVLMDAELSLGLGLGLDNPSHYASSLFFGLARSPIDFLLTMLTIGLASVVLFRHLSGERRESSSSLLRAAIAPLGALPLFVGTNVVLFDTWLNSSLALSRVSLVPFDAPRLAMQVGLVALELSAVLLALLWLGFMDSGARSWGRRLRSALADLAALGLAYALVPGSLKSHVLLAAVPLFAVHSLAIELGPAFSRAGALAVPRRLLAAFGLAVAATVSFFPAVAYFEDQTIRSFLETTVAPVVLQHERSRLYVMAETARGIDRMIGEGDVELDREDAAYRIWVGTDLAVSSLSSSVEVVDSGGRLVSRFALSFPFVEPRRTATPAPMEWIVEEGSLSGEPSHPGFLLARRAVRGPDGELWEIRFRLASDWRNLPFISTSNPYLALFRSAGSESPPRFPYQELELFVLDRDGNAVFQSREGTLRPGPALLSAAGKSPLWWEHPHELQTHRTYLFADETYVYALSYPDKRPVTRAAELASWALLGASVVACALGIVLLLHAAGIGSGLTFRELVASLGRSFYGKLFVAFILVALVPIVLLAFVMRGVVVQQFQLEVEQEGVARARVVEELIGSLELLPETARIGEPPLLLDDSLLERVGNLADVDVDVFREGELLATSKPELFASGLLRTRAVPSAFREIVLERLSQSIHRESVGSFDYLVVSVPLEEESWDEIGIVSVPLASRTAEIDRKVESISQAVLLAALGFSLVAALLAYSLARRISDPINTLTDATHRIAEGDLDVSLEPTQRDEIGALFASFTQMAADLKQQRDDLERSKKLEAWAEMARQVAHEVKNPLTPIQLATEHLRRVYGDEDVDFERVLEECSETILQQVKTLRQISMEFSTFASPEPLNFEPVDLGELARETLGPYLQTPPEGMRLRLDEAPGVPSIQGDRRLLKRTLVNLIENALHAVGGGGEEGRVDVALRGVNANGRLMAELVVGDTGPGIDPEIRARVFEPYFSTKASGTGLGLAIAKKVVEDHGGTIALESETGVGTRVVLRLPAAEE